MTRPFRFGVQSSSAASRSEWISEARLVESLGYSTLTMPDHFTEQLAPVPALMTAADATTTLRIGALVWDNDYKHPVVFAKEMATMDVLSDGRLEIGIGHVVRLTTLGVAREARIVDAALRVHGPGVALRRDHDGDAAVACGSDGRVSRRRPRVFARGPRARAARRRLRRYE